MFQRIDKDCVVVPQRYRLITLMWNVAFP